MKNVILLTILLIPFLTIAQESPAVKYFDKYSGNQGYTSAHITKHTFDFFTKINNNEEGKAFSENIAGVNTIKILIYDRPSKKTGENLFYNELLPSIHKSIYDEIMEVKEDEQNYKFFTKMENNKISEFLIVAYGPIENILVIIQGDINLNKLSKLSGTMNIEGFDHLGNIEKMN